MKSDIRRQTFSKPAKPSDEEIKRLTSDETENACNRRKRSRKKCREKILAKIRKNSAKEK